MSTMASSSTFSTAAALIAANLPAVEKEQFQALWKDHLKLRDQGKIVYFLPRGMGTQMGAYLLRDTATRLSLLLETPVYIHFDVEKSSYRVGQVFDDLDHLAVKGCIFVYKAEYPQLHDANPVMPSLTPVSQPSQDSHNVELSSIASDASLRSSKQEAEKIPKPRNMWIIYRQDKHSTVLAENPGMHTSNLSTIIGDMWRNEPAKIKAYYKKLADLEKAKHQLQYPEYKCSPRKSSEIKKRKRTSTETLISIETALPAAKAPRLSEKISQGVEMPSPNRCEDNQIHGSVFEGNSETDDTPKSSGDGDPFSIPPALSSRINWQPFQLFGMESNGGAYEQPPDDLFLDADILQPVDWEANDALLDWLL